MPVVKPCSASELTNYEYTTEKFDYGISTLMSPGWV